MPYTAVTLPALVFIVISPTHVLNATSQMSDIALTSPALFPFPRHLHLSSLPLHLPMPPLSCPHRLYPSQRYRRMSLLPRHRRLILPSRHRRFSPSPPHRRLLSLPPRDVSRCRHVTSAFLHPLAPDIGVTSPVLVFVLSSLTPDFAVTSASLVPVPPHRRLWSLPRHVL